MGGVRLLTARDLKGWETHVAAVYEMLPKEAQQAILACNPPPAGASTAAQPRLPVQAAGLCL